MQKSWHVFLAYAKAHPKEIPTSMKERSRIYHSIKDKCYCGDASKMCSLLSLTAKVKQSQHVQQVILEAKVKAYEEELAYKDKYIAYLEKHTPKVASI